MKFIRKEEESFAIELTSMVDVVFLLLIFFMVSTAFIEFARRLDIELPESKAATIEQQVKSYEIEIDAKGMIYLNGVAVTMRQLEEKLKKQDGEPLRRAVLVKADRRIDYGKVVAVMGISKAAGINEIGVAVK